VNHVVASGAQEVSQPRGQLRVDQKPHAAPWGTTR
jgi:hypothetical protein